MSQRRTKSRAVQVRELVTLPLFASAMRKRAMYEDFVDDADRPPFLSSGLVSLDRTLGGGFPLAALTLVAARARVGVSSLLIGAALAALKRGERVAFFSDSLRREQLKGRFVVLESRVNGHRFKAGFVSADDRLALIAARDRIPWSNLSLLNQKSILPSEIEGHIFSYSPWLVLLDIKARLPNGQPATKLTDITHLLDEMNVIAKKHGVAMILRYTLPRGQHPPMLKELPGQGEIARDFASIVLLHREEVTDPEGGREETAGIADAFILKANNQNISPRQIQLKFDHRYAGLSDL